MMRLLRVTFASGILLMALRAQPATIAPMGSLEWFANFGPFGLVAGMLWLLLHRAEKRYEEQQKVFFSELIDHRNESDEHMEAIIVKTTSVLSEALVVQGQLLEIIRDLKGRALCVYAEREHGGK